MDSCGEGQRSAEADGIGGDPTNFGLEFRPKNLAMSLDWAQCSAVESVPVKLSEDGLTIGEIVELYDGLTREQVEAVLNFIARSLETVRGGD